MLNKIVKDYLSFTKKERIAVIMLIVVIIGVFLLPSLIPAKKDNTNDAAAKQFFRELAQLKSSKPDSAELAPGNDEGAAFSYNEQEKTSHYALEKKELFYFDPNTISPVAWKKLGLRNKTIKTIQNYISKGGRFRHPKDIGKIYGMRKEEVERLLPYVHINSGDANTNSLRKETNLFIPDKKNQFSSSNHFSSVIDLNTADTSALIALPGIGNKLAARIVNFRDKLGGFYSLNQLAEVYGLPDSTFQKLSGRFKLSAEDIVVININTADVNDLKQHPYIKWNAANAIVEFRRQHGNYKSLEELLQIDFIAPDLLKKVSPYLKVE